MVLYFSTQMHRQSNGNVSLGSTKIAFSIFADSHFQLKDSSIFIILITKCNCCFAMPINWIKSPIKLSTGVASSCNGLSCNYLKVIGFVPRYSILFGKLTGQRYYQWENCKKTLNIGLVLSNKIRIEFPKNSFFCALISEQVYLFGVKIGKDYLSRW